MFSYENLAVYKKSYKANQRIYQLLKENKSITSYVKNQLGRASLSIMLNIAEGGAKLSNKDRVNFYVTARGSAFECSSLVSFLYDVQELPDDLKQELYSLYEEISKMLFTMIRNLQK